MWTTEVLGEGANGSVVRAVERATRRKVAVKSFANRRLTRLQKKDIEREIAILSRLDHPKVVRLEAVYRSEKFTRLVLEDLEGGDVFQSIEESGRVDEAQAALVIRQLLQAVEHLHDSGVVHRDIKLENIVYESDRRDKVKLIDFGFGESWHEGMQPMDRFCGTLAYLAPEVVRGASYTNKVDVWGVGAAAHTMLTGDALRWFRSGGLKTSQALRRCSRDAQEFVALLLDVDPSARPSASEALRHRWLRSATADAAHPRRAFRPRGPMRSLPLQASEYDSWDQRGARTADLPTFLPLGSPPPLGSRTGATLRPAARLWRRLPSLGLGRRVSTLWSAIRGKSRSAARVRPDVELQHALQVVPQS